MTHPLREVSVFRAALPLTNVCITEITNLKTSISSICQDDLAQNERAIFHFCEHISVAVASVREVIVSIKSPASQISHYLEPFQSTHVTLFSSWNVGNGQLSSHRLRLFICFLPGSISFLNNFCHRERWKTIKIQLHFLKKNSR